METILKQKNTILNIITNLNNLKHPFTGQCHLIGQKYENVR
jgi:hypothetical protein